MDEFAALHAVFGDTGRRRRGGRRDEWCARRWIVGVHWTDVQDPVSVTRSAAPRGSLFDDQLMIAPRLAFMIGATDRRSSGAFRHTELRGEVGRCQGESVRGHGRIISDANVCSNRYCPFLLRCGMIICYKRPMLGFENFRQIIETSLAGRSAASVCREAGLPENAISLLRHPRNRMPSLDRASRLLDALGLELHVRRKGEIFDKGALESAIVAAFLLRYGLEAAIDASNDKRTLETAGDAYIRDALLSDVAESARLETTDRRPAA